MPLRVELHPERKAWRTFDGEGFDQPVRRQCFYAKARRQTLNALAMNGIDLNLIRQAEAGEKTTRLHPQRMAWSVLHLDRLIAWLAVVHHAGNLLHLLVQGAAKRHVHFLEAAADAEHRDACRHCITNQRQGSLVTMGIMGRTGLTGRAAIVMRFDIRRRASEQQAV